MIDFQVDSELCIACGECVQDCPVSIISMASGTPTIPADKEANCIRCQHCLAVCPTGAVSILGVQPKHSLPIKNALPSREQMETLVMGRRSVRRYSDTPVDKDDIDRLMQVLAYAPSGRNNCELLLTLVDDAGVMDMFRKLTYKGIELAAKSNRLPAGLTFFSRFPELLTQGRDVIFCKAPHMLVVSSPQTGPSPDADCFIALSYFELLAASAGLGTLWCGLAKWAMQIVPEMRIALGVPEDHLLGYVMLFGNPSVTYQRTVQRGPANVRRLKFKS